MNGSTMGETKVVDSQQAAESQNQNNPQKSLSNEQLFDLRKKYGLEARMWRQKFAGLLPEVNRRRLYEKKGFNSIFKFAAKLAGMSQKQVRLVLNLERKFEDKPVLKSLLENGEVSVNKLMRVTSIATTENEEILAGQIKLLTQKAVEVLVRDEKFAQKELTSSLQFRSQQELRPENQNGFQEPLFEDKSLRAHGLQLDEDVENELLELQRKGININELLRDFLRKREEQIEEKKEKLAAMATRKPSRYINAKTRDVLKEEYGTKCSINTCNKPSIDNHHTQRFSLSQIHDPHYMALLCKEHHLIAHTIDMKFHEKRRAALRG